MAKVFELLVRERVAPFQVLMHGGGEVLLLGDGVPHELDRQGIYQPIAVLTARLLAPAPLSRPVRDKGAGGVSGS